MACVLCGDADKEPIRVENVPAGCDAQLPANVSSPFRYEGVLPEKGPRNWGRLGPYHSTEARVTWRVACSSGEKSGGGQQRGCDWGAGSRLCRVLRGCARSGRARAARAAG